MDYPREALALRLARLLLACWWVICPFVLGYGGTFVQKQDVVAGLLMLPILLFGLAVGGGRSLLFVVGAWMLLSPSLSGMYFEQHTAFWNDRITGLLAMFLSLGPWHFPARAGQRLAITV